MARINVDVQALSDVRFFRLGRALGAPASHAHWLGIGIMIPIWHHLVQHWSDVAGERAYQVSLSELAELRVSHWRPSSVASTLCTSDLAEKVPGSDDLYRIKGTRGRIEWLARRKEIGKRTGGMKKPKPDTSDVVMGAEQTTSDVTSNPPPPAPAPAPAPAQVQEPPKPPVSPRHEFEPAPARSVRGSGDRQRRRRTAGDGAYREPAGRPYNPDPGADAALYDRVMASRGDRPDQMVMSADQKAQLDAMRRSDQPRFVSKSEQEELTAEEAQEIKSRLRGLVAPMPTDEPEESLKARILRLTRSVE